MGMRQNIKLIYNDKHDETDERKSIYIYSHWGGEEGEKSELRQQLRKAIARKQRWDDESYLARIIISEVVRDSLDEETGTGLAPYETDPEYKTIVVDLQAQTVDGQSYDDFIKVTP